VIESAGANNLTANPSKRISNTVSVKSRTLRGELKNSTDCIHVNRLPELNGADKIFSWQNSDNLPC
ncbi:hypothetical protein Q4R81_18710, partial [Morganella morganii]